jgi:hypothetical protein
MRNYKKEAYDEGLINKQCFKCEECFLSEDEEYIVCGQTETFVEPEDEESVCATVGSLSKCPIGKW